MRGAWRRDGIAALVSAWPPKLRRLSDGRFAELENQRPGRTRLEGPALDAAKIRILILRQFALDVSPAAVGRLMHRHGWFWQSLARWAVQRDKHALQLWKNNVQPRAE
ncbi:hypothetical protein GCM10010431_74480 [Streptomyces kunmingensis]|uniref:helix-turn-helix domain-containing protein n=1 Tax=Streptomyces kunmingensis TaxID=68225 RepID=UPI00338B3498